MSVSDMNRIYKNVDRSHEKLLVTISVKIFAANCVGKDINMG